MGKMGIPHPKNTSNLIPTYENSISSKESAREKSLSVEMLSRMRDDSRPSEEFTSLM